MRAPLLLATFSATLLLLSPAGAQEATQYADLPAYGSMAPAFGLLPLGVGSDKVEDEAVFLDNICGVAPGATTGVLIVFTNNLLAEEDLALASKWHRRYEKQGLRVLVIAADSSPEGVQSVVASVKPAYPVLDDRYGVVQARYGIPGAPYSFMLDRRCRVLGFSDMIIGDDEKRIEHALDRLVSGEFGGSDIGG